MDRVWSEKEGGGREKERKLSGSDCRRVAAIRQWAKECVRAVHDDGRDNAVGKTGRW
jgi:hypothetical protein